jgi:hypothetical protein
LPVPALAGRFQVAEALTVVATTVPVTETLGAIPAEYMLGEANFHASGPESEKKIRLTPVALGRAENTSNLSFAVSVMLVTIAPLKEKSQSGVPKLTVSCSFWPSWVASAILNGPAQTKGYKVPSESKGVIVGAGRWYTRTVLSSCGRPTLFVIQKMFASGPDNTKRTFHGTRAPFLNPDSKLPVAPQEI